ncbi:hypothetical protein HK102_001262, partial [Quaeritorhiza haematococci]
MATLTSNLIRINPKPMHLLLMNLLFLHITVTVTSIWISSLPTTTATPAPTSPPPNLQTSSSSTTNSNPLLHPHPAGPTSQHTSSRPSLDQSESQLQPADTTDPNWRRPLIYVDYVGNGQGRENVTGIPPPTLGIGEGGVGAQRVIVISSDHVRFVKGAVVPWALNVTGPIRQILTNDSIPTPPTPPAPPTPPTPPTPKSIGFMSICHGPRGVLTPSEIQSWSKRPDIQKAFSAVILHDPSNCTLIDDRWNSGGAGSGSGSGGSGGDGGLNLTTVLKQGGGASPVGNGIIGGVVGSEANGTGSSSPNENSVLAMPAVFVNGVGSAMLRRVLSSNAAGNGSTGTVPGVRGTGVEANVTIAADPGQPTPSGSNMSDAGLTVGSIVIYAALAAIFAVVMAYCGWVLFIQICLARRLRRATASGETGDAEGHMEAVDGTGGVGGGLAPGFGHGALHPIEPSVVEQFPVKVYHETGGTEPPPPPPPPDGVNGAGVVESVEMGWIGRGPSSTEAQAQTVVEGVDVNHSTGSSSSSFAAPPPRYTSTNPFDFLVEMPQHQQLSTELHSSSSSPGTPSQGPPAPTTEPASESTPSSSRIGTLTIDTSLRLAPFTSTFTSTSATPETDPTRPISTDHPTLDFTTSPLSTSPSSSYSTLLRAYNTISSQYSRDLIDAYGSENETENENGGDLTPVAG